MTEGLIRDASGAPRSAAPQTAGASAALAAAPPAFADDYASSRDYWRLMKPRVMSLVIFTAFVGLVAAPVGVHPVIALASLVCVAIGAGASGALNMWWDADIDARMARTSARPVPRGAVGADEALGLGVALSVLSVGLLSLFANAAAAALLAITIAFYVFVYTMWLKRRTPQNIVIGGAAGAFPPMIGWTIATGGVGLEAVIMFAIIFFWTPPHSWALALFRREDYHAVDVPMMPVAAGIEETRRQIWLYTLAMTAAVAAPLATNLAGPAYAVVVGALTFRFLQMAWAIRRRDPAEAEADRFLLEKKFFGFSIVYLFGVFAMLLVEAIWRGIAPMLGGA